MMFQLIINVFRYYAPMILGLTYVLGYERKKLDNLLKFLIINVNIILMHKLI